MAVWYGTNQKNSTQQIKLINYKPFNLSGTPIPVGFLLVIRIKTTNCAGIEKINQGVKFLFFIFQLF